MLCFDSSFSSINNRVGDNRRSILARYAQSSTLCAQYLWYQVIDRSISFSEDKKYERLVSNLNFLFRIAQFPSKPKQCTAERHSTVPHHISRAMQFVMRTSEVMRSCGTLLQQLCVRLRSSLDLIRPLRVSIVASGDSIRA